ncbi:unnamed protein product (macronuclear) [Paramecium tetraurelia]|uniref:Uncharacterized protein n=1 Tax=Paramecium tetraurelia TaxID=5888 RepID=A0BP63_PARTE|nr:uncharacterized protein GSPATT00005079001 [Paramecium tetraurelia]CAK60330.1 unnamed protein product [Paramecium tetraurelia]|eukprot:XP_001427728.1 hypothetical protein (macronuclear) [Paramecium tetraurelia strain d4-2]
MSKITKEEAYKLKKLFFKSQNILDKYQPKKYTNISSRLPSLQTCQSPKTVLPMKQCVTQSIKELLNANVYQYIEGILYTEDCVMPLKKQPQKVKKIVRFVD